MILKINPYIEQEILEYSLKQNSNSGQEQAIINTGKTYPAKNKNNNINLDETKTQNKKK